MCSEKEHHGCCYREKCDKDLEKCCYLQGKQNCLINECKNNCKLI